MTEEAPKAVIEVQEIGDVHYKQTIVLKGCISELYNRLSIVDSNIQ